MLWPIFVVGEPPWQRNLVRQAPWEVRKEVREAFFKNLNPQKEEIVKDEIAVVEEEVEDLSGLEDLPWGEYQAHHQGVLPDTLLWPVLQGRLTSGYGVRRGRTHEGIDVAAPMGSVIRAVSHGRVVFNGTMIGYGKTIVLYHGEGTASVYAHNQVNLVKKEAWVRAGDPIARVGRSGKSRGVHIHFEIRKNGKPVNPLSYSFKESPLLAQR